MSDRIKRFDVSFVNADKIFVKTQMSSATYAEIVVYLVDSGAIWWDIKEIKNVKS